MADEIRSEASPDAGVTPAFNLDQGLPAYPLPPLIVPAFSNNNAVDWFNGQAASRPAAYDNWTVSVQREVGQRLTVEVDYNGVYGSHLQAGLLNPNQVPMSGDRQALHANGRRHARLERHAHRRIRP